MYRTAMQFADLAGNKKLQIGINVLKYTKYREF